MIRGVKVEGRETKETMKEVIKVMGKVDIEEIEEAEGIKEEGFQ